MKSLKKKIVITGGEGRFAKTFKKNNNFLNIFFPNKKELNILSIKSIEKYLKKIKPKYVLHAAGLSRPMNIHDTKISKSIDLNIIGTANIVKICEKKPLIFDIGGNLGEWSLCVIKKVTDAKIHMFEPSPMIYNAAQTNLQNYNITPIIYYKTSPQSWMVYQSAYGLPLIYLGPPTIQLHPQDATASIGDSIMISVEATDVRETALSYQWLCNGIDIAGKTAANLSIVSLAQSDVGNYQVKATNTEGTTISEGASLTIANTSTANGLYTQEQYDAALTSGFNLGIQSAGGSIDNGNSDGSIDSLLLSSVLC